MKLNKSIYLSYICFWLNIFISAHLRLILNADPYKLRVKWGSLQFEAWLICWQAQSTSSTIVEHIQSIAFLESLAYTIGIINPKASNGHLFILVAFNFSLSGTRQLYMSTWKVPMIDFIKYLSFCRYGLPQSIITDNAIILNNYMMGGPLCTIQDFPLQFSTISTEDEQSHGGNQ